MKKTIILLLVITINFHFSICNAQSDASWEETIDWIKSKSSYYNIHHDRRSGRYKQSFVLKSNDDFYVYDKNNSRSTTLVTNGAGTINESDTSETIGYFTVKFKGSLHNLNYRSVDIIEDYDDESIAKIQITVACESSWENDQDPDSWSSASKFTLYIKKKDDMPVRIANAFVRLSSLAKDRKKSILEKKLNDEKNRIKSYGEKF